MGTYIINLSDGNLQVPGKYHDTLQEFTENSSFKETTVKELQEYLMNQEDHSELDQNRGTA